MEEASCLFTKVVTWISKFNPESLLRWIIARPNRYSSAIVDLKFKLAVQSLVVMYSYWHCACNEKNSSMIIWGRVTITLMGASCRQVGLFSAVRATNLPFH